MGGSIDGFSRGMMTLADAYDGRFVVSRRDSPEIKDGIRDSWRRFFTEYDGEVFAEVADEWVKENQKPPAICDLIPLCKKKKDGTIKKKLEELVYTEEEFDEMVRRTKETNEMTQREFALLVLDRRKNGGL